MPAPLALLLLAPLLQSAAASVDGLAVSPDDRRVAWRVRGDGHRILVAARDGSGARCVAGGAGVLVSDCAWAGNERLVLVASHGSAPARLWSVGVDGGAAPVALDRPDAAYAGWFHATAERVLFRGRCGAGGVALHVAPADGRAAAARVGPPTRELRSPVVTPDGARVLWLAGDGRALRLHSSPPGAPSAGRVLDPEGAHGVSELVLEPGGARVAFTAGAGARSVLVAPLDGSAPARTVARSSAAVAGIAVAGRHVVFRTDTDGDGEHELLGVPLDGSAAPRRLTPRGADVADVRAATPDGARVLYDVACGPAAGLHAATVERASEPMRVHGTPAAPLALTADSRTAVFTAAPWARGALQARVLDGSAPAVHLGADGVTDFALVPGTREVVCLARTRRGGPGELLRVPLDGPSGRPPRVLPPGPEVRGVHAFRVSGDGTLVFLAAATAADDGVFAARLVEPAVPLRLDRTGPAAGIAEAAAHSRP